ncbi:MAG: hypothetical protein AAF639_16130 [Chloroflexota bacterium]
MNYIFIFEGEFGFELLNWQGVIRKFAKTIEPNDKILCCSRANLYPLYEMADEFIDISDVPLFKRSRASMYRAIYTSVWVGRRQLVSYGLQQLLKLQLRRYITKTSSILREDAHNVPCKWVFSSHSTTLNGCVFGAGQHEIDIYDLLDVDNNDYRQIEPDLQIRTAVEAKLGWSLTQPFILIQGRKRDASTQQLSHDDIPQDQLITTLSEQFRVVLLNFDTGRWLDSYSEFADYPNCVTYPCRSFPEQACLIHFAKYCVFFTEGDFGSHIYVPPLMGKDVIAIAPRSVYEIGSTPLALWNQQVFQFGGQIMPKVSEAVLQSTETVQRFVTDLGHSTE